MQKLITINHQVNQIPPEIEARIKTIQPGQVIKIRINPSKWKPVRMQTGKEFSDKADTNSNASIPPRRKVLCSHWTTTYNGTPYACGFVNGANQTTLEPRYAAISFNIYGEINLDETANEFYRIWQLSPENRWNVWNWDTVLNKPIEAQKWLGEEVDASKENAEKVAEGDFKFRIESKVRALTDLEATNLMQREMYGFAFYNQRWLEKDPKAARDYILTTLYKGPGLAGYHDADKFIANLEKAVSCAVIHDCIMIGSNGVSKWVVSDTDIRWAKNNALIATLSSVLPHPNNDALRAIEIFKRLGSVKNLQNAIMEAKAEREKKLTK